MSFRRYIDEHHCTQEDLASRLKIDRSTLANLMRLLELPRRIQDCLGSSEISAGHARALLPLGEEAVQLEFCDRIIRERWSVRDTERNVSERITSEDNGLVSSLTTRKRRTKNSQVDSLERQLKLALGTKVKIRKGTRGRGWIQIEYSSNDEFERLKNQLAGENGQARVA